jgi:putative YphP/YqiW family bacilliredoxin
LSLAGALNLAYQDMVESKFELRTPQRRAKRCGAFWGIRIPETIHRAKGNLPPFWIRIKVYSFLNLEGQRSRRMYPEIMVLPMREELTRLGIEELRTADAVDRALRSQSGTALVVVNSICGCAAGRMRPAVRMALEKATHPDKAFTVFAGQDLDATERARSYFTGQPPSSPSIAIVRDGQLVYMMPRRDIESREAPAIAADLKAALDKFCAKTAQV